MSAGPRRLRVVGLAAAWSSPEEGVAEVPARGRRGSEVADLPKLGIRKRVRAGGRGRGSGAQPTLPALGVGQLLRDDQVHGAAAARLPPAVPGGCLATRGTRKRPYGPAAGPHWCGGESPPARFPHLRTRARRRGALRGGGSARPDAPAEAPQRGREAPGAAPEGAQPERSPSPAPRPPPCGPRSAPPGPARGAGGSGAPAALRGPTSGNRDCGPGGGSRRGRGSTGRASGGLQGGGRAGVPRLPAGSRRCRRGLCRRRRTTAHLPRAGKESAAAGRAWAGGPERPGLHPHRGLRERTGGRGAWAFCPARRPGEPRVHFLS